MAHPDLIFVPAVREVSTIKLRVPVDSSALGTPLIDADGIIGLVDSEKTGIASSAALRLLELTSKRTK